MVKLDTTLQPDFMQSRKEEYERIEGSQLSKKHICRGKTMTLNSLMRRGQ